MDLAHDATTFSELKLSRRVRVAIDSEPNSPRTILDLEVPFRVEDGAVGSSLSNMTAVFDDCLAVFEGGRQNHGEPHDGFRLLGAYPFKGLHPAAIPPVLDATIKYIRAVSFGLEDIEDERSFEIGGDLPTQRVLISSWGYYGLTADNLFGRIELLVDYPDLPMGNGRKPIDEIRTFLTGLYMRCLGSYRSDSLDLEVMVALRQAEWPGKEVPEDCRTIKLSGGCYGPIGGGYRFEGSSLHIIANDTLLPGDGQISEALEELLRRLLREVPSLCE